MPPPSTSSSPEGWPRRRQRHARTRLRATSTSATTSAMAPLPTSARTRWSSGGFPLAGAAGRPHPRRAWLRLRRHRSPPRQGRRLVRDARARSPPLPPDDAGLRTPAASSSPPPTSRTPTSGAPSSSSAPTTPRAPSGIVLNHAINERDRCTPTYVHASWDGHAVEPRRPLRAAAPSPPGISLRHGLRATTFPVDRWGLRISPGLGLVDLSGRGPEHFEGRLGRMRFFAGYAGWGAGPARGRDRDGTAGSSSTPSPTDPFATEPAPTSGARCSSARAASSPASLPTPPSPDVN